MLDMMVSMLYKYFTDGRQAPETAQNEMTSAEVRMNAKLDRTLLPALDAIYRALEVRPAPVRDTATTGDYHVECFKRQCERDAKLRQLMQPAQPRVYEDEGRDAAEFFAAEQCPSDASFR